MEGKIACMTCEFHWNINGGFLSNGKRGATKPSEFYNHKCLYPNVQPAKAFDPITGTMKGGRSPGCEEINRHGECEFYRKF